MGYRDVLVATPEFAFEAQSLAKDITVVLAANGEAAAKWLRQLGAQAALIRPDRYLAGIAGDARSLAELLSTYAGRCARARYRGAVYPPGIALCSGKFTAGK